MIVSVFTSHNEVLVFPMGPDGLLGKDDFSDRDWEEYDEELVELPLRISSRGFDTRPERSLL